MFMCTFTHFLFCFVPTWLKIRMKKIGTRFPTEEFVAETFIAFFEALQMVKRMDLVFLQ